MVDVESSVDVSESPVHLRTSVLTELTVENHWDVVPHDVLYGLFRAEEEGLHCLRSVQIHCSSYVASVELVVESAVDDYVATDLSSRKQITQSTVANRVNFWVPAVFHSF